MDFMLNNALHDSMSRPAGYVYEMLDILRDFRSIRCAIPLTSSVYKNIESSTIVHAEYRVHQVRERVVTVIKCQDMKV